MSSLLSASPGISAKAGVPTRFPKASSVNFRPSVSLTPSTASGLRLRQGLPQRFVVHAKNDEFVKGGRVGPDELTEGAEAAAHDIQEKAEEIKDNIVSGFQNLGDNLKATGQGSQPVEDAKRSPGKKAQKDAKTIQDRIGEAGEAIKEKIEEIGVRTEANE